MFTWIPVKDRLKSSLFHGFHIVTRTPDAEIFALLRKLAPVDCGIDLIRVGGDADGGYLIPDDLNGVDYCFSPGVGASSSFEDHLAAMGIRSFLADGSVDGPSIDRPEFTFDKKFLGATDSETSFTLSTWKDKYLPDYFGDLLLQMDIEGAEYEVLLSAPDSLLDHFRIVIVEFHGLDRLFDPFTFALYRAAFDKLLRLFNVVHIHPNNQARVVRKGEIEIPTFMEFTFLNRRRVRKVIPRCDFPHRLDRPCSPGRPMVLPKCWYLQGRGSINE